MLKVQNRAELAALAGKKPAAAAPAPIATPAPVPAAPSSSEHVEKALVELSQHVRAVATIAAETSASVAALADRPNAVHEAEIVRDVHGKMTKIIITTKKNADI